MHPLAGLGEAAPCSAEAGLAVVAARNYCTGCGARLAPGAGSCRIGGQPVRSPGPSPPRKRRSAALLSCLVIVLAVLTVLFGSVLCLVLLSLVPGPGADDVPIHLRNRDEKEYLLELLNRAREEAGVPPVRLGRNIAAQVHAEEALERCFAGHWDGRGLKPYMRYSLVGGYQPGRENVYSRTG